MNVFEERYARLNPRQKEAVDNIEGPVMVIAGPGTGKTTILTLRIANILRITDTPPSGILAITYTDAGVKAMKQKLREIVGTRADEVRIHTFHSLAASLIAEFTDHFPHLSKSKQATDTELQTLIRNILKDIKFKKLRPIGDPDLYIPKIISSVSDAKREALTPGMLQDFSKKEIKRIKEDPESISSRGKTKGLIKGEALKRIEKLERTRLLADVYSLYEETKKEARRMDYDDLLTELLRALRDDELFLQLIQEKFLYISVDEHQDTNDVQNSIIRTIADFFDEPNLFIVGDEKQAIYRFQGASVENFLTFQNTWKTMRIISLSDNYRSHQSILDAGYALIDRNYKDDEYKNLRIPLISKGKKTSRSIDIIEAGNIEASEGYLIKELRDLDKYQDKTIAIITRKNREVSRIASLLESEGIKASAERGADILKHPIGILFFKLINVMRDTSAIEDLALTIAGGLWNISFEERIKLIKEIRSGQYERINEIIPELEKLRSDLTQSDGVSFLMRMAHVSGLVVLAIRDNLGSDVWRALVKVGQELAQESNIYDPCALIDSLVAYEAAAESKGVKIRIGLPDARISVMTAHSSKGLEFDYVFIVNATEESWMSRIKASYFSLPYKVGTDETSQINQDEDSICDSRRLFYVALTRAREHAVVVHSLEKENGKILTPVRFIDELDIKHISKTIIPASRDEVLVSAVENIDRMRHEARIDHAKRVLIDGGISVSTLNNFIACPSTFYIRNILKLPEPLHISSEKGNAMHSALSSVWKLEDKNIPSIKKEIDKVVREYFSQSLLSVFEKEIALTDLIESIPHVAKSLHNHFLMDGEISTEKWFETDFYETYEGEKISLRLHGRMDSVVITDGTVHVFDYKTKEKMSEGEIRGTTQSSDGNYFRQLAFYTMLLKAEPSYKGKNIIAGLVFVKPDKKGECPTVSLPVESKDIDTIKTALSDLIDSVWSGSFLTTRCDDPKCAYCPMMISTIPFIKS